MRKHRRANEILMRAGIIAALLAPGHLGAAERPPEALQEMRAKFAAAVAADDLRATMALTHFPLKNEAYQNSPWISRAAFPKRFRQQGYLELAHCLKSAPLEVDLKAKPRSGSWFVNCNGNVFHFPR
jgi:hypothetical protein